jgi:hypothetical protein
MEKYWKITKRRDKDCEIAATGLNWIYPKNSNLSWVILFFTCSKIWNWKGIWKSNGMQYNGIQCNAMQWNRMKALLDLRWIQSWFSIAKWIICSTLQRRCWGTNVFWQPPGFLKLRIRIPKSIRLDFIWSVDLLVYWSVDLLFFRLSDKGIITFKQSIPSIPSINISHSFKYPSISYNHEQISLHDPFPIISWT